MHKHFVHGQDVLFSNPHQQGLVKIHNTKGKIVDALSGNYYHVMFTAENEQDSSQTQHSIALHASSLAPFLPTEKPVHEQTEKCREISLVERISHFAALSKASMRKKRPRKNKSESKQVTKKSKLATLTRLPKVKQTLLSKQSQLMYKSQVTSMRKTMHAGKDLLKNCLSTIELMIAGHLQCWNNVSNEEKRNLHQNVKYIHDIIGNHASQSIQKQVSSVSSQPWMQYQGCSAYCGLCALNNAYRQERFTVEMLDNIADNLWLRQIEHLGMSLTSEVQCLRDISGYYSIEVLMESVSRMSDDLVNVDGTMQHIMAQNTNADNFVNELALIFKFPRSFILAWRAQNHYTCVHIQTSTVWHFNSLKRQPQVLTSRQLMKILQEVKVIRKVGMVDYNLHLERSGSTSNLTKHACTQWW